jgi:transposase InsO family protein
MPLFEPTAEDLAMLHVPDWAKGQVGRRLELVRCCLNGDWRTRFTTKNQFNVYLAGKEKISVRHLQRLTAKYRATVTPRSPLGDATVLMDTAPGPARGDRRVLEDWMVADIDHYFLQHLTKNQIYDALVGRIKEKQHASVAHLYRIPSRTTVYRFIRNIDPFVKALEEGSSTVKRACGYIDRDYKDLQAGAMWCIDEWQVDAGAYDPEDARVFGRPWIVTLLDARSRFVLAWTATFKYNHDVVLDLVEEAVRNHGRPDYFYSDKGAAFRGRLGRQFREVDKEKLLGPAASALEILGTVRRGPGEEKNPRANPLERRHRIFAESARLLPTWCGSHPGERPEEYDDKYALHEAWIRGKVTRGGLVPLSEIAQWFTGTLVEYHIRPSSANGLNGLSPSAAYREFATDADRERRRVEPGLLLLAFAESFPGIAIRQGGVIELRDHIRYSHPELLLVQGQRRDVKRARHDKSFIVVLPAWKGEEPITAWRRDRVGTDDPESLSRQCELLASIRKIAVSARPLPDALTPGPGGRG